MSSSATEVNGALIYILAISALLLYLIVFFTVYFAIRYRKSRNPVPTEIKDNKLLEAVWVIIPTIIVLTMFVYGLTGYNFLRKAPADSMLVKVHSRQWSWLFEYENGKKSADLIVPMGKNVRCELTSDDVIHGFYIPDYRIQLDTVPGITTQVWFNASALGSHYILCSQYCGLKHSVMLSKLVVVSQDQFAAWMRGEEIELSLSAQFAKMPPGERLLFERGCVSCHSLDGSKMVGPTFRGLFGTNRLVMTSGQRRTVVADHDYIVNSIIDPRLDIVEGFPGTMPSGKDILSPQEIEEIINYLKTIK